MELWRKLVSTMAPESSSYDESHSSEAPAEVPTSPAEETKDSGMKDSEMKGDDGQGDGGNGDGENKEKDEKVVDPPPPPPAPPAPPPSRGVRVTDAKAVKVLDKPVRNKPQKCQKVQCTDCGKWINDDENSAWQHLRWGTCRQRQEKYGPIVTPKQPKIVKVDDGDQCVRDRRKRGAEEEDDARSSSP